MNHRVTAMRNGVYTILAVIVGVMLVGMLPGQLSNLAASTFTRTVSLQAGGTDSPKNITTANTTGLFSQPSSTGTLEDVAKTTTQGTGTKPDTGTTAEAIVDYSFSYAPRKGANDPYLNDIYYGLWGIGLVVAIGVYFTSKRMLG